ncbi:FkbM family methyltransferase [Pedobacter fastidiosus]|uniref:FkbM family methyltransferase n=1 Tax=Pedobacter fastidiosus TaxID=2765361 RepID=A0ABR7KVL3_9SPHI|nr:FkbM family methyltransferase [Pedobacter fastidiosus]MBC6112151.1 FkbM family methyltransferase [Pedobacter fastidiosus]
MLTSISRTLGFINRHPLAKKHLFKAYTKFLWWQIKSRASENLIEVPFLQETKFFAKKGLTGITGNIYSGLHEFEDMSFLIHFLRAEDTFFDVGANVGSYTILASGIKKAKTIAFEPIKVTWNILSKNVMLNHLEDLVICKNNAVGSEGKDLYFTNNLDTTNHMVTSIQENSSVVNVITLNSFYEDYKPNLIKIDVEGFETEVINGASQLLNDNQLKAIIIELNGSGERYGYNEKDLHHHLTDYLFFPHSYDPFKRELVSLNSFGGFNTIYIRDIDFVRERLRTSLSFNVFNESI